MSAVNPKPYRHGAYLVCCDICGRTRYDSETRMNWKGLRVCADTCWEPKDPQWDVPIKMQPELDRVVPNARPPKYVTLPSNTDWSKIFE